MVSAPCPAGDGGAVGATGATVGSGEDFAAPGWPPEFPVSTRAAPTLAAATATTAAITQRTRARRRRRGGQSSIQVAPVPAGSGGFARVPLPGDRVQVGAVVFF